MFPEMYTKGPSGLRRVRPAGIPNRGIIYLPNDDNGMGGWFKNITRAVTAPFKAVVKAATQIARPIGKVLALPVKLTGKTLIATHLPGSKKLGKPLLKIAAVAEEVPVAGVRLLAAGAKVPFTLTRGITTGQIGRSLHQVEVETRQAGGKPLAWLVKGAKVIVPAVLSIFFPPIGLALAAAIVARDAYWANRENKQAQGKMENEIRTAYQTYVEQVNKAGVAPTDYNTFRNWVLAGATGDIPLGSNGIRPPSPGGIARTMPISVSTLPIPSTGRGGAGLPEQPYGGGGGFAPIDQPIGPEYQKAPVVAETDKDKMLKYLMAGLGVVSLVAPKRG